MHCGRTRAVKKNTPFLPAFALQNSSINPSPAPELELLKLIFARVFFSGGVFVQTPVGLDTRQRGVLWMGGAVDGGHGWNKKQDTHTDL